MTRAWRAGNALIAAAFGIASVWGVVLVLAVVWLIYRNPFGGYHDLYRFPPGALVQLAFALFGGPAVFLIWSGILTLAVTTVLILPYVCLRSSYSILLRPWRMYLEPCLIAIAFCFLFFALIPSVDRKMYWSTIMSCFAIPVSLASSFFFLRRVRREVTVSSSRPSFPV